MTDNRGHASQPAIDMGTDDADLVRGTLAREGGAFRMIMQKYNQRLYRIARSMLRNDSEAEDAVQEAYVSAFTHMNSFRGESSLPTWLSRIVMNEALGRIRSRRAHVDIDSLRIDGTKAEIIQFPNAARTDPERTMAQRELLRLVEHATDRLPNVYRVVFVARVIEGLSTEETAEILGLRPETVKTRLHRARRLVRQHLDRQIGPVMLDAFPFAGERCERMTANVMARLGIAG